MGVFLPAACAVGCVKAFVNRDKELAAFCVENSGDVFRLGVIGLVYLKVVCVCCDDIKCVDGDDFCGVGQIHDFGYGHSYAQSCEAAGPRRDVYVFDVFRARAEVVEEAPNSGKNLSAVPHRL